MATTAPKFFVGDTQLFGPLESAPDEVREFVIPAAEAIEVAFGMKSTASPAKMVSTYYTNAAETLVRYFPVS